jgi:HEAT repeat protein
VLAALGDEMGVAKLRELTNDADAKIRFEAVLALGALADKGSKDLLIQRLKDPNLAVRASAIYALGQSGDPKVIPVIQKALAEASAYQESLRKKFKDDTSMLHNEYGINAYNLEVTLEEAIGVLKKMDD